LSKNRILDKVRSKSFNIPNIPLNKEDTNTHLNKSFIDIRNKAYNKSKSNKSFTERLPFNNDENYKILIHENKELKIK